MFSLADFVAARGVFDELIAASPVFASAVADRPLRFERVEDDGNESVRLCSFERGALSWSPGVPLTPMVGKFVRTPPTSDLRQMWSSLTFAGRSIAFPKTYQAGDEPSSVRVLVQQVLPRLLEGEHPTLVLLREQLRQATVTSVELGGGGFFAHLAVPPDLPLVEPPRIAGGDATISLSGCDYGAGCMVVVDGGRLSLFEGYTHACETWAGDAQVVSIDRVTPLDPTNVTPRS